MTESYGLLADMLIKDIEAEVERLVDDTGELHDEIRRLRHDLKKSDDMRVIDRAEVERLKADLNERAERSIAQEQEIGRLCTDMDMLLAIIDHAAPDAWSNGNTDPTGSIDEGTVLTQRAVERVADSRRRHPQAEGEGRWT